MTLIRLAVFTLGLALFGCAGGAGVNTDLAAAVAARSAEDRARDGARHPAQTLAFFQVQPGMVVAETLPGGGWYTRVLANYLGGQGTLYGVNYSADMLPLFPWMSPERIEKAKADMAAFDATVAGFTDNGVAARGFAFNAVPTDVAGTADRVLFIRSLHHLSRFEGQVQSLTRALADTHAMLKADGLVGVVQHRAPEDAPPETVLGHRGYLKQSDVVAAFEVAGFELVKSSEINANPKDQPGVEDVVWRLPPSLRGTQDNPELKAQMQAIGESDRMTLLFRKAG
ncbi:MAG: class I SAM-dependent methyltransferase [Halioglobus sp.]|nr:class I SAM-dependent methyltransferase [Halioglobus sp.]